MFVTLQRVIGRDFRHGFELGSGGNISQMLKGQQPFDAKAVVFAKVVAENRDKAKASLYGLKAAAKPVGDACDNCHNDYRLSRR